jgi:hypothetical protein
MRQPPGELWLDLTGHGKTNAVLSLAYFEILTAALWHKTIQTPLVTD